MLSRHKCKDLKQPNIREHGIVVSKHIKKKELEDFIKEQYLD